MSASKGNQAPSLPRSHTVSIIVALVMSVSILLTFMGPPSIAFAQDEADEVTSGGLIFVLNEETGTAEVKKRSDLALDVTIPETITANGRAFTVTSIGWGAFHSAGLTSVTMPNTITVIDVGAFYLNNIENIQLSSALTNINRQAFRESGLKSLELPASLVSIGEAAFYGTNLGAVSLPASLKTIEKECFRDAGITSLMMSEGITQIPLSAFSDNRVTNLVLPDSVTDIDTHAFIRNPLTSLKLPAYLKTIGWNAFYGNKLTSVTVPGSVTSIEKFAFTVVDQSQRTIHFEGDAPAITSGNEWGASLGNESDVRVTYNYGAAGFTAPRWGGYRAEPLSTTVAFDSRNGTAVAPKELPIGATLEAPAPPTRPGYTFNGWYSDNIVATPYDFDAAITGPLTLYAGWTVDAYTVTWHTNLPSSGNPTVEVIAGATLGYVPEPTAAGLVISSWNTRPDGSGVTVEAGTLLSSVTEGIELELYAIWDQRTLALSFAPGSASSAMATAGDTVHLKATANAAFGHEIDVSDAVQISSTVASDTISQYLVTVTAAGARTLTGVFDGATATVELGVIAGPLGTLTIAPLLDPITQGASQDFSVTGADASGNPVSVDAVDVTLSSNIATDAIDGVNITFSTAGTRQITATVRGVSAAPVVIDVIVLPRYVVTWNENWPDASAPTTSIVTADQLSDLPDPSAASWVIVSWNTKPDGSGISVGTDTPLHSVASGTDLTLYAIWQKRTLSLVLPTTEVDAGSMVDLTAVASAAFGQTVDVTAEVSVVSSDDSDEVTGATVLVTRPGIHTFTASYDGATATAQLKVKVGALEKLTLTPSALTVAQGGTLEFVVTGTDAAGNTVEIDPAEVTLSSDVATDEVRGMSITFPTASPHRITVEFRNVVASVTINVQDDEVTPPVEPTGPNMETPPPKTPEPTPPPAKQQPGLVATGGTHHIPLTTAAALLLVLGTILIVARRRLSAAQ